MPENPLSTLLPRNVELKDPILLASGCCGYGDEYHGIVDPADIGGIITKAVSLNPRAGNDTPRLRETPAGLLNCIGLQNPGVEVFCRKQLPEIIKGQYDFFINVVGHRAEDFAAVIKLIEADGAASACSCFKGYELDLSCPNVDSGTEFATDLDLLHRTTSICRSETDALVVAKLSPNVTDIVPYAECAVGAGADAVTIANTWNAVSIDIRTRKSNLSRPSAGLSGPAIRPATLYQVMRCHLELPEVVIFGSGGITDAESAIEFLLAGATVLQVGTGLFLNPGCPLEIRSGLERYLAEQGEPDVKAIVGTYAG